MTREEAKENLIGECKIIMHYTWSEDRQKVDVPHWYLSDSKTLKLVNKIYDYFEQRNTELEAQQKPPCAWKLKNDEFNSYGTSCGYVFYIECGTPKANDMNFCPKCGGKIKVGKNCY
jgi:hypothetical protein